MKKKIIFSMSCIALLSILLSMVLSGVVSYYDSLEIVKKATIAESHYIQNGIALGGDDYLSDIRSAGYDTAAAQSVRVTVIDTDGTVRFDSVADAANMENHNDRPEVIAARENGAGESVRESDTLNVQSYNYAVMLSDGRVLRLSVGMKTVFGSIERMVPWMLLCSVIILVLAILLSTYRTKQIVAPVNAIDLDHPMENDVYGELSPLLLRLQRQNETIKEKMEELHRKQTELLPSPKTCARALLWWMQRAMCFRTTRALCAFWTYTRRTTAHRACWCLTAAPISVMQWIPR